MSQLILCVGIVVLLIIVPIFVGFVLWCNDRKKDERKGYWDSE